jgi:hypothetical protein
MLGMFRQKSGGQCWSVLAPVRKQRARVERKALRHWISDCTTTTSNKSVWASAPWG